jgi:hypothetical protein
MIARELSPMLLPCRVAVAVTLSGSNINVAGETADHASEYLLKGGEEVLPDCRISAAVCMYTVA